MKVVYINVSCIRNIAEMFHIFYSTATHMFLKSLPMFRRDLNDETRGRFAEQPYDIANVMMDVLRREIAQVNPYAQRACYGHLGESNGQPALGKIMAGAYQPFAYSGDQSLHNIVGTGNVHLRASGLWEGVLKYVLMYQLRVMRGSHVLGWANSPV